MALKLGFLSLLPGSFGTDTELVHNPVPSCLGVVSDLSKDSLGWGRSTVLEVRVLATGQCAQLVGLGALRNGLAEILVSREYINKIPKRRTHNSIAVKI